MDSPSQHMPQPRHDHWSLFWRCWWIGAVLVVGLFAVSFALPGETGLSAFMGSALLLVLMTLPVSLLALPLIDLPMLWGDCKDCPPSWLGQTRPVLVYLVICAVLLAASYWMWRRLEAWNRVPQR